MFSSERLDGFAELFAELGSDHETGCLFDQLLVAALDGALAFAEAHDIAVLVSEHLELNVAGALDELLHVEVAVAESVGGLGGGLLIQGGQIVGAAADAHAATAAAGDGFEDDGIADGPGPLERLALALDDAVGAGEDGHLGFLHRLPGGGFLAHEPCDLGRRPDELDIGGAADFGEVGVFAEQAVARVNGIDVGDLSGGDHGGDVEIAFGGARGADADGLVGEANVERVAVGLAVDRDGADAHLFAGADDAKGDLTSIRDQDFLKHIDLPSRVFCRVALSAAGW